MLAGCQQEVGESLVLALPTSNAARHAEDKDGDAGRWRAGTEAAQPVCREKSARQGKVGRLPGQQGMDEM